MLKTELDNTLEAMKSFSKIKKRNFENIESYKKEKFEESLKM